MFRCCPKSRGGICFRNCNETHRKSQDNGLDLVKNLKKKPLDRHNNSMTDGTVSLISTAGSTLHPQIPAESIIILNCLPAQTKSFQQPGQHPSMSIIIHIHKNGTIAKVKFEVTYCKYNPEMNFSTFTP